MMELGLLWLTHAVDQAAVIDAAEGQGNSDVEMAEVGAVPAHPSSDDPMRSGQPTHQGQKRRCDSDAAMSAEPASVVQPEPMISVAQPEPNSSAGIGESRQGEHQGPPSRARVDAAAASSSSCLAESAAESQALVQGFGAQLAPGAAIAGPTAHTRLDAGVGTNQLRSGVSMTLHLCLPKAPEPDALHQLQLHPHQQLAPQSNPAPSMQLECSALQRLVAQNDAGLVILRHDGAASSHRHSMPALLAPACMGDMQHQQQQGTAMQQLEHASQGSLLHGLQEGQGQPSAMCLQLASAPGCGSMDHFRSASSMMVSAAFVSNSAPGIAGGSSTGLAGGSAAGLPLPSDSSDPLLLAGDGRALALAGLANAAATAEQGPHTSRDSQGQAASDQPQSSSMVEAPGALAPGNPFAAPAPATAPPGIVPPPLQPSYKEAQVLRLRAVGPNDGREPYPPNTVIVTGTFARFGLRGQLRMNKGCFQQVSSLDPCRRLGCCWFRGR